MKVFRDRRTDNEENSGRSDPTRSVKGGSDTFQSTVVRRRGFLSARRSVKVHRF